MYELTVGFETNVDKNSANKENRYQELLITLRDQYEKVTFVNLSMSSIGTYGRSCFNLSTSLHEFGKDDVETKHVLLKLSKVILLCLLHAK